MGLDFLKIKECTSSRELLGTLKQMKCVIGRFGGRHFHYQPNNKEYATLNEIIAKYFELCDKEGPGNALKEIKNKIVDMDKEGEDELRASSFMQRCGTLIRKSTNLGSFDYRKRFVKIIETEKREHAAVKIQNVFRGFRARQGKVNPNQVKTSLKHLIGFNKKKETEQQSLSIIIARKVNDFLQDKKLWGTFVKIERLNENVVLHEKKGPKKYRVQADVDMWLFISSDGTKVTLKFKGSELGAGNFKGVFREQTFDLQLKSTAEKQTRSDYTPSARINLDKSQLGPMVFRGQQIHEDLYKNRPNGVYFTDPMYRLSDNEYSQTWYASDLHQASKRKKLPMDVNPDGGERVFSKSEARQCLRDVAITVGYLHQQGKVHKDVKPGNINVRIGEDSEGQERPIGYLADFDFASRFGHDQLTPESDYAVWDPCQVSGISTPYCDWYGVALSLVTLTIPGVDLRNLRCCRDKIGRMIQGDPDMRLTEKDYQDLFPNSFFKKFRKLKPHQQEVWKLFCDTCQESAQLLQILKRKSKPNENEVLNAMENLTKKMGKQGVGLDRVLKVIDQVKF